MVNIYKNWVELLFFSIMVIGILISLLAPSAAISYIIMFLSGMLAGRIIYQRKGRMSLHYYMIISGFVIGYLLGAYYGSRLVTGIIFMAGAMASYRLYEKKILSDTLF